MPAEQISFRVAFEGPLTEFTRRHPGVGVSLWCDWKREIIEIGGASREAVDALAAELRPHSGWMERFDLEGGAHVLALDCIGLPHDFVNEAVDRAQCLALPPTRFVDGWEHYNVVSFRDERTRDLIRSIKDAGGNVELLTKKPLRVQPLVNSRDVGASLIVSGLSDRQTEALHLAFKHGYYATPRKVNTTAIADAAGVARSTFDEHLRKAENKVMANLFPYVELTMRGRIAPEVRRPRLRPDPSDALTATAEEAAAARRRREPGA